MPRMDGLELARLVREAPECFRIPILFLRTSGNRENMLEAVKAGIEVHVVKPFLVMH